jgi:hypothetical protein
MKKLLLAAVFAMAISPAMADTIVATARVDGVLVNTSTSASASLNVVDQSFGPIFNNNTLSVESQAGLALPGVLTTNTFNVNQVLGGTHDLVIDVVALGLAGPGALTSLLSTFSVSGLPTGWSIMEQTFINNVLLSATPVFTGVSDSASATASAFLGSTFNAEAIYTIHSVGVGNLNGGIDISVAAVPGPVVGAGLPGLIAGMFGLGGWYRRKRQKSLVS